MPIEDILLWLRWSISPQFLKVFPDFKAPQCLEYGFKEFYEID